MTESSRPSAQERAARLRAARAKLERTAEASEASPNPRPKRAGGGARLALAGGAVGLGFGLVGMMAAGAGGEEPSIAATTVRRVVIASPDAPVAPAGPVVVVMTGPLTDSAQPDARTAQLVVPERAAAPAPAPSAPAPVTASHGS